jgi:hypothetical protein
MNKEVEVVESSESSSESSSDEEEDDVVEILSSEVTPKRTDSQRMVDLFLQRLRGKILVLSLWCMVLF